MSSQIQEVLQQMRLTYVANMPQQLDTTEALVMELKKGEDYQYSYDTLYRAVHNLKGTAGTYGVPIISTICHPFEDYLTATLEGGSGASDQQIRSCLRFIDLLRRAHDLVAAGRQSFPEIEASLATI
jgi:chemotaxis protein histidine kinase CheA